MGRQKRIIVSVTSDLATDQRVHKVCLYLHNKGAEVLVIGRQLKNSLPLSQQPYRATRINCFFNKGPMQYVEFNFKLFLKLLFIKADIFLANDLDTLAPNFIISFLRRKKLVYDSHEYFTGMFSLVNHPFKKKVWAMLENWMLPRIKYAYTVNKSISDLYQKSTGIKMRVVRNVPLLNAESPIIKHRLPLHKKILLMQGAGANADGGYEEALLAMKYLPNDFLLVLIGGGTIWEDLHHLRKIHGLEEQVIMIPRVPFPELAQYTYQAHLGLSLTKPVGESYTLSLPNKIFDYIHAGVPVLASNLPEVRLIITTYNVGAIVNELTPENIANKIEAAFKDYNTLNNWKSNTVLARKELNWQKEIITLDEVYTPLLR